MQCFHKVIRLHCIAFVDDDNSDNDKVLVISLLSTCWHNDLLISCCYSVTGSAGEGR